MDPAPLFAHVEFLNLEKDKIFEKVQCRVGGVARQILENAVIQMKATFSQAQLCQIVGSVRRAEEAARLVGDNNDYPLMKSEHEHLNLADNFVDPEHGPIPIPEVINGHEYKTVSNHSLHQPLLLRFSSFDRCERVDSYGCPVAGCTKLDSAIYRILIFPTVLNMPEKQ